MLTPRQRASTEFTALDGARDFEDFSENTDTVNFSGTTATLPADCANKITLGTLPTEAGFIVSSGTVTGKPIVITLTHGASVYPLSFAGTELSILVGAETETERILVEYDGSSWNVDSIGLVDQVI